MRRIWLNSEDKIYCRVLLDKTSDSEVKMANLARVIFADEDAGGWQFILILIDLKAPEIGIT